MTRTTAAAALVVAGTLSYLGAGGAGTGRVELGDAVRRQEPRSGETRSVRPTGRSSRTEIWSSPMGGFLVSKASYGDFELRAEVWVTPDANSGIFIRAENPKEIRQ